MKPRGSTVRTMLISKYSWKFNGSDFKQILHLIKHKLNISNLIGKEKPYLVFSIFTFLWKGKMFIQEFTQSTQKFFLIGL